MAITDLVPDAEVAVRAWAVNDAEIAAVVGANIATRLPEDPVFPFLTLYAAGGEFAATEAPLYEAIIQFDAFGARGGRHPDYASASLVIRTVMYQADNASNIATPEAHIYGFDIFQAPLRIDEPDTEWARYTMTVIATMRSNV